MNRIIVYENTVQLGPMWTR